MQNSSKKCRPETCKKCSGAIVSELKVNFQQEIPELEQRNSPSAEEESAVETFVPMEQGSQLLHNEIQVSKLDANEYLLWQWEKLVRQLNELDEQCPDGSSESASDTTEDPSPLSPLTISEGALRLHRKSKDMGCPEWTNRFLLLIGHRLLTISKGRLFLSLPPEEVCEILSSDFLNVENERSVLRAAHRWLDYDNGARTEYMPFIMGCVRYGLMPKEDIIKSVVTRRHMRQGIISLPPFQRTLVEGLIWICLVDLGIQANFPEFEQIPRLHPGVNAPGNIPDVGPDHYEGPSKTRDRRADHNITLASSPELSSTEQITNNGCTKRGAVQVVSQVTAVNMNSVSCGGRHMGGRSGRYH